MTEAWGAAWPAPAKLNLFLHITGRRADGYHTLQTAFRFLDYGDRLFFSVTDDGAIRMHSALTGIPEERNLILRAATLLRAAGGCASGVIIRCDKRLPMGGGLGGGSSDAATTLVALDRLWGLGLGLETLADIGLKLGADVPVFVRGQAAWAEGVGEVLTPMRFPHAWYVVLLPGCMISTAEVFAAPELTRNTAPIRMSSFRFGIGRNDCEDVVLARYPEVRQAFDKLAEFTEVRMTGTGACVFGAFSRQAQAAAALAHCQAAGLHGFMASGLDRSPLLDRLDQAV